MKSHNTSDGRQMESLLDRARVHPERSMVMLNLNRYKADVEFPHGGQYSNYMAAITHSVEANGGAVLWRADVQGSVVGGLEGFHEVLAVWYPNYEAFTSLPDADGAKEMFRYRKICVEEAHIIELSTAGALTP